MGAIISTLDGSLISSGEILLATPSPCCWPTSGVLMFRLNSRLIFASQMCCRGAYSLPTHSCLKVALPSSSTLAASARVNLPSYPEVKVGIIVLVDLATAPLRLFFLN